MDFDLVVKIILAIGTPTILGTAIYIGRKLQVLDDVEKTVKSIYERFIKVETQVDTLWKDKVAPSSSPRHLNDYGERILNESGIKEIIEEKREKLLGLIKEEGATNAYDAERITLSVVDNLPTHCPDIVDRLKAGAFKTGASLATVLLVGGIYLRDLIFSELGFSLEEIDVSK